MSAARARFRDEPVTSLQRPVAPWQVFGIILTRASLGSFTHKSLLGTLRVSFVLFSLVFLTRYSLLPHEWFEYNFPRRV